MRARSAAYAVALALALTVMWSSFAVSAADASLGELSFLGCLGQLTGCAAVPAAFTGSVERPKGLAVSPDEANVYAADADANTIDVFSRNALTGELAMTECVGQHSGCATTVPAAAVEDPFAVAVSPDGKNVYAVSAHSNTVVEFSRDTSTGALTYTGCIGELGGCVATTPTEAIDGPASIAISADGTSVYVASENAGGAVDEFSRNADNGALTFSGCIGAGGCTVPSIGEALRLADAVAISPDGNNVYVSGQGASVSTFTRNTSTGALTFQGCVGNSNVCVQPNPLAINEPGSLAVSPDGANLYAGNFAHRVVDGFSRNTSTGALTVSSCNGALSGEPGACTEMAKSNPAGPLTVAVSPDGADVYVSADQGVYEYARGSAGALTFAGCVGQAPGVCTATVPAEALAFTESLALSANGASLYSGAQLNKDISVFARVTPPAPTTYVPPAPTPTPTPMPTPTPTSTAPELALQCQSRALVLTDVFPRGARVLIYGVAAKSLAGKRVTIVFDGHTQVASAVIAANGLFSTTAPLPAAKLRGGASYLAEVGATKSLAVSLTRRLVLDPPTVAAGKVTLTGEVVKPLADPVAKIVVRQRISCTKSTEVEEVKPSAGGAFHITLTPPSGQQAVVYSLSTIVRVHAHSRKLIPTFSLPQAVELG